MSGSSVSQCGWCGRIDSGSTQGLCISQSVSDSNRALCDAQFDPYLRINGACEPLPDQRALAIGLGVYFAATFISACVLAYVVKQRRNGSCAQVTCWFCIGVTFSVMAWYMLQCWGPKPRDHSQQQPQPDVFSMGSAPPASASVEAAVHYAYQLPPPSSAQQAGEQYNLPPPFNPHALPAPQVAAAYAPQQWQDQGRQ